MEPNTTTENFLKLLTKKITSNKFQNGTLKDIYNKLSNIGIDIKSTYSFPLKDTIGKTFKRKTETIITDSDSKRYMN